HADDLVLVLLGEMPPLSCQRPSFPVLSPTLVGALSGRSGAPQTSELDEIAFYTWDDAADRFPGHTAARIPAARQARNDQRTIYLPQR
ncbi:hypothetical protein, partial [Actinomadura sp. 3N407]|uniref:hypothetical protein n=1 Tax=Actinomadura sp. 3N407 TaxID=3457423 RepID=UPI003FCE1F2E